MSVTRHRFNTTPGARARRRGVRLLAPIALAVTLALGLTTGVRAQSLQELYEAARGYDATYLAARAQADSAQYAAAQANALRRPSASLSASATRSNVDPAGGSSFNNNSSGVTLSGKQPLFNRANGATVDQAAKQLEASRFALETAEQDLIVRVAQAYFDVLAAQDALDTTRTAKAAISEQLASAKRNFEVGTATITDTREAQARFDLATAQEIAAENDLLTRRITLDQLVGRSNVAPNQLAAPVVLPPVVPAAADEWVARADAQHPAVRQAQLALDVATLETDKARAGHLPTLDAVASLSRDHSSTSTATSAAGSTQRGSVGLQFNLPLFAGFAVQNRVKETLALEEKSRQDLEAARRTVAQGTRQAFFGVQSGQAQVTALEAAESSSQLALEATQLGYRVGVRVNLDVLNAQTQLFNARRDLAQARYNVVLGTLRLRQAAGQLSPADVADVNRLLVK